MYPDTAPESMADNMTAAQRLKQFEIKEASLIADIGTTMLFIGLVALLIHYVDEVEAFLMWVGL